uniref:Uncharacterized protein n=1 Tax=Arundo donax TaxID=35708 RepID=A0A0A9EJ63_ARUDO
MTENLHDNRCRNLMTDPQLEERQLQF